MSACFNCGKNYDDSFKFCPYCGSAKLEPDVLDTDVQSRSRKFYEEASLQIKLLRKDEITEYPFNWRPNVLVKMLGDPGHGCWTEVSIFRFILTSIHPEKGKYIIFESNPFRAFYASDSAKFIKFPTSILDKLTYDTSGQEWVRLFFSERKQAWEQLNLFLIKQGWIGLTQKAIKRAPPFKLQMPSDWLIEKRTFWLNDDGYLIIDSHSNSMIEKLGSEYRYQHQLD